MLEYLIRRLLLIVVTVIGVTMVIFALLRVVPGDAATAALGDEGAGVGLTEETRAEIRRHLGLDEPLVAQYGIWIWNLVRLDPGDSFVTGEPITQEIRHAIPITLQLAVMSFIIATVLALTSGVLSALKQDTWVDYLFRILAAGGLAMPGFWLGILTIVALSLWFDYVPFARYKPFFNDPWGNLQQFFFPALILGCRSAAVMARMVRSSMLEVLKQEYITTAWAKGLRQWVVIGRHAIKNAAIPVVTLGGFQVAGLLGGVVVVERVFNLPGTGTFMINALLSRDYYMVQTLVTLFALVVIFSNFLVDMMYAWLDPRVRYRS